MLFKIRTSFKQDYLKHKVQTMHTMLFFLFCVISVIALVIAIIVFTLFFVAILVLITKLGKIAVLEQQAVTLENMQRQLFSFQEQLAEIQGLSGATGGALMYENMYTKVKD